MENTRYLPADRVSAGSLPVECLSVRTSDDREIGKLVGFVIADHHIRSLIVESADSKIELPMGAVQFDEAAHLLRLIQPGDLKRRAFAQDSVPQIGADDLWIPLFHSAA